MTHKPLFIALALMTFGARSWAQVTLSGSQVNNTMIPDNDLGGISESIDLGSSIQSITDVQLTLDIGGNSTYQPWNGDYYAYLQHGSSIAVLLNRVGVVNAANPLDLGYSDTGMDVTFSDSGSDIHNYQSAAYSLNVSGQLTGTWAPDGRNVSPSVVTAADPQNALLSAFDGDSSDGDWTLFIADTSEGDIGNLVGWSLDVTGTPVTVNPPPPGTPDSSNTLALLAIGTGFLALRSSLTRRPAVVRS